MKIAVLSDIHSAADHFRDALQAARKEGFDQLLILGDLFTYGPEPVETAELAQDAAANDDAVFIMGNHDLLYVEQPEGETYASQLPDWIRESVEWTQQQLKDRTPVNALPWQNEWSRDGVLFSHANPFGFGDWTYLRDEESMVAASRSLQARSFRWGVFGHVHRFRILSSGDGRTGVATVGSIGQPRDKAEQFGQWSVVTTGPQVSVEQRRIERDWSATIEKIRQAPFPETTKERLCQFYR